MTDGNTAVQVSPIPTEAEMSSFRSMLDRALNAIVEASQLAQVVKDLRHELDELKHEIGTVRDDNRWLDEQLSRVRTERDEAKVQIYNLQSDLALTNQSAASLRSTVDHDKIEITNLNEALASERKARSEAEDMALKSDAKLAEVQGTLDKIRASLGIVEQKAPEPVSPATSQAQPRRVYQNEEGFSWDKPHPWDNEREKYYNEG